MFANFFIRFFVQLIRVIFIINQGLIGYDESRYQTTYYYSTYKKNQAVYFWASVYIFWCVAIKKEKRGMWQLFIGIFSYGVSRSGDYIFFTAMQVFLDQTVFQNMSKLKWTIHWMTCELWPKARGKK